MNKIIATADTLLGSLLRENFSIRARYLNIESSISNTQDTRLIKRLVKERTTLLARKNELHNIVKTIDKNSINKSLTLDLLLEICRRPVSLNL